MSRKTTGAWNTIHSMCKLEELDEQDLYARSKMLLSIYRRVCWTTIGRADCVAEDIVYYCGNDLDGALIHLRNLHRTGNANVLRAGSSHSLKHDG